MVTGVSVMGQVWVMEVRLGMECLGLWICLCLNMRMLDS